MIEVLDRMARDELISYARRLGVSRPELLTRVELKDEIVRVSEKDDAQRKRLRGWLGVARDLLASVVEQGLHLPDAAALIRGGVSFDATGKTQRAVATVTLADIYAAQGHLGRALSMLDEVLEKEPDHDAARALRDRLSNEQRRKGGRPRGLSLSVDDTLEQSAEAALDSLADAVTEATPEPIAEAAPEPIAEAAPEPIAEATPGPLTSPLAEPIDVTNLLGLVESEPAQELDARLADSEPETRPLEFLAPALDAVVLIRADDKVHVYWELSLASVERARRRAPDGHAVVELLTMWPSWDGAERSDHSIPVTAPTGLVVIDAIGTAAAVRAALGWRTSTRFRPIAIALELSSTTYAVDEARVRWAPFTRVRSENEARELEILRQRALARFKTERSS